MESEILNSNYTGTRNITTKEFDNTKADTFCSPVDDNPETGFDLNRYVVRNKSATYFFRMNGDSMEGAGIFSGDVLIVDRSMTEVNGKVVVAVLNGEMLVRRLDKGFNKIRLVPETSRLAVIDVDPFSDFSIWGVVTYVVHAP
jgi:DNA polymerase V